jgi:glycerol uptake facilitator protein
MAAPAPSLSARCIAEVVGTFLLVFFGCGAVHVAILTGALAGLWQVAVVWGVAIMVAIYLVGGISGAHINPAVTVALAAWGRFAWRDAAAYIAAQLVGAFAAAAMLFLLFNPLLADKERVKGVVRGQPGSEITAMCYGEYFPDPGRMAQGTDPYKREDHERLNALVPETSAIAAEVLGTLILVLVIFAVTDPRNAAGPGGRLAPVFIGLTVSILIAVIAPLTQACFNPARDFGPRIFAALAGWGTVALPGPRPVGTFLVYLAAPVVGGILGGGVYRFLVQPAFPVLPQERNAPHEKAASPSRVDARAGAADDLVYSAERPS